MYTSTAAAVKQRLLRWEAWLELLETLKAHWMKVRSFTHHQLCEQVRPVTSWQVNYLQLGDIEG